MPKATNVTNVHVTAQAEPRPLGNSQLLIDYRKALISVYTLGEMIKEVYNIIPPAIIYKPAGSYDHTLRLSVN